MMSTRALILTHGCLGVELLAAARQITGEALAGFDTLCLEWDDTLESARGKVAEKVRESAGGGGGLLILTDMYGGTPYNVALTFREAERIEILTGVNLPMILRLACSGELEREPAALAAWLLAKGRRSICVASGESEDAALRQSGREKPAATIAAGRRRR